MVGFSDDKVAKWIADWKKKVGRKYNPDLLLLFGSRARKDHLLESDVDVIIVSKRFENVKWPDRLGDVSELWDGYVVLEPLCYTPEEFRKKKSQFGIVQQALKEGVEL
jgi:predicted nucleotidyltransferase